MTMHLRSYHIDDVAALAAIANMATPHPWTKQVFYDCFNTDYQGWVICDAAQIRGFIMIKPIIDECELMNICVDPLFLRQGLARMMLDDVIMHMRSQGYVRMLLEVRASNIAAIALYEAFGFSQTGLRKGYYPQGDGREDAVLMDCLL